MADFLLDLTEFMSFLIFQLNELLVWFMSTVIGEITLFMLVILVFLYLLKLIIMLKD